MQIVPGILTDDIETLNRQIEMAVGSAEQNLIEWIQIDFIDGEYADNLTVRPKDFELRIMNHESWKAIKFEAHLMVSVENLGEWLRETLEVGFDRITAQVESVTDQKAYVEVIKTSKKEVGLSLALDTRVEVIDRDILSKLDVIQVMTVGTGFSGQEFVADMLWKVRDLKKLRDEQGLDFKIEVDGGVNVETIKLVKDEGVDLAEVNSGLYKDEDFEGNLKRLYQQIKTDEKQI